MPIYQEIKWLTNSSKQSTYLKDGDILTHVPGGIELAFKSSPSTTTFYPYHRIHSIETIDTDKAKKDTTL